jgi:uncharacterized protein YjgD (DUF1641 family)
MAVPIALTIPRRDPRAELQDRLAQAPVEHAEALLAAYAVLQGLHDRGILEGARGLLGSSDQVMEILVDAAKTPEAIRGTRNFIILTKLMAALDPVMLEGLAAAIPTAVAQGRAPEPLGFWALLRKLLSKDSRRAISVAAVGLESAGKALRPGPPGSGH